MEIRGQDLKHQHNEISQIISSGDNDGIVYNNHIGGVITNTSCLHEDIGEILKAKNKSTV